MIHSNYFRFYLHFKIAGSKVGNPMQAFLQELIFRNLAHGLCDVAEAVRIADQVELFHMREKDRVADTVREIVHTAELVSHRTVVGGTTAERDDGITSVLPEDL